MNILVKSKDLGFFTQEPVGVTRFQSGELVWCNHANYETETLEGYVPRQDEPDIDMTRTVLICTKCDAYKVDGDAYWMSAPSEGVSHDA